MRSHRMIKVGLMTSLIVSLSFNFFPQNADAAFRGSYPVPELSGNYCDDIISVAESQLGYTESSTGETVYSSWAGQSGRSWCSEFVAWCADRAGIPTSIIPVGTSTSVYRDFFSKQGRYYILNNGNDNNSCGCAKKASKTISISDIKRGDILLIETSGGFANGADHTCLVVNVNGNTVTTIDGNSGNQVRYRTRTASVIHGVCRPMYNLTSVSLKAKKVSGKKIKLKWTKLSNVKGYQIYRSTKKSSGYRLLKTVKKNVNVYKNANVKAGTRYYYKVRAYKVYKGKKIYGKYSNVESVKVK